MRKRGMKLLAGTLLALSLLGAGEFDNAMEAYKKGSYIEALNGFYILAKNGDAKAQFNVGLMYAKGEGAQQDLTKAMSWYEKAAEQNVAAAQYNLARLYHAMGTKDPHALERARYWYEKAAQNGIKEAYNNLGALYLKGEGVKKDTNRAFSYFQKASEMGDANAKLNLGILYAWGEGINPDKLKAYDNLRAALQSGQTEAQRYLDRLCKESSWVCQKK